MHLGNTICVELHAPAGARVHGPTAQAVHTDKDPHFPSSEDNVELPHHSNTLGDTKASIGRGLLRKTTVKECSKYGRTSEGKGKSSHLYLS